MTQTSQTRIPEFHIAIVFVEWKLRDSSSLVVLASSRKTLLWIRGGELAVSLGPGRQLFRPGTGPVHRPAGAGCGDSSRLSKSVERTAGKCRPLPLPAAYLRSGNCTRPLNPLQGLVPVLQLVLQGWRALPGSVLTGERGRGLVLAAWSLLGQTRVQLKSYRLTVAGVPFACRVWRCFLFAGFIDFVQRGGRSDVCAVTETRRNTPSMSTPNQFPAYYPCTSQESHRDTSAKGSQRIDATNPVHHQCSLLRTLQANGNGRRSDRPCRVAYLSTRQLMMSMP